MQNNNQTILRLPQVIARTGLGRSTIYAYMHDNKFPKSIRLGARAVGWLADDIDQWISDRINGQR